LDDALAEIVNSLEEAYEDAYEERVLPQKDYDQMADLEVVASSYDYPMDDACLMVVVVVERTSGCLGDEEIHEEVVDA